MDLSGSEANASSQVKDMDLSDTEKSSPSKAENINSSGPEASGSSLPGDPDLSDAEDKGSSGDKDSSANPPASSVIRFSGPVRRQNWSLPESIIFYMAKNPSTPKLYQKLIRTCKYFFLINPIIICSDLTLRCRDFDENSDDSDVEDENDDSDAEDTAEEEAGNGKEADKKDAPEDTHDYWQISQVLVKKNICYGKRNKKIDFKNYSAKIWIVDYFCSEYTTFWVHDSVTNKNIVSSVIPKIYRCNAEYLELYRQNLSFVEFSFLATSVIEIWLFKVTIKFDDGKVVSVEKIVECATKAQFFNYIDLDDNGASISSGTVKNLLSIPHFTEVKTFFLKNIPVSFDVETLFAHLKERKSTSFHLHFSDLITAGYKKRLEKIIDEILDAGGRGGYKSPVIDFSGIDEAILNQMYKYYHASIPEDL